MSGLRSTSRLAIVAAFAVLALACTSGNGTDDPEPSGSGGSSTTTEAPPRTLEATATRVELDADSPFVVSGEDRVTIGGSASDGEVVLAAGTRHVGGAKQSFLVRSDDGRAWADVSPDGFADASTFMGGVVHTGTHFLVAVATEGARHVVYRSADGMDFEIVDLAFVETDAPAEPVLLVESVGDGDVQLVFGEQVELGATAAGVSSRLAVSRSADGGATWQATTMPAELVIEGAGGRSVSAAVDGERVAVVTNDSSGGDALWESPDGGATWERRGAMSDLLGVDVESSRLHFDAGQLVVFATPDGEDADLGHWTEGEDGSFDAVPVPEHVFGGDGRQLAGRVAVVDGTLVVVGRTRALDNVLHDHSDIETWFRHDGEWQRAWSELGLVGDDASLVPEDVALVGEELVVVGTEQRHATEEEIAAFEADPPRPGQPVTNPPPSRRQTGAVWAIAFEEVDLPTSELVVTRVESPSFGGEADEEMRGVASDGELVVAAGQADAGEELDAAVWTSSDLEQWERVDSPALGGPGDQAIYAVEATDAGFVAVGMADADAGGWEAAVWTSADGTSWERRPVTVPESVGGELYAIETFDGRLYAAGEQYRPVPGTYRLPLLLVSSDDGATWSNVDTTQPPFREELVDFLVGVAAVGDELYVTGHQAEPADREDGGFQYSPSHAVRSTVDGETWEGHPVDGGHIGTAYGVVGLGGEALVYGSAHRAGEFRRSLVPMWPVDGSPETAASFPYGVGLVEVVAEPFRMGVGWSGSYGSDSDAAIVELDEDGTIVSVAREAGLVADGDQEAADVAVVGDTIVVVGSSTEAGDGDAAVWKVERA